MVSSFQKHFSHHVTMPEGNVRLHMMVRFRTDIPNSDMITKAEQVGIALISVNPLYLDNGPSHEFVVTRNS